MAAFAWDGLVSKGDLRLVTSSPTGAVFERAAPSPSRPWSPCDRQKNSGDVWPKPSRNIAPTCVATFTHTTRHTMSQSSFPSSPEHLVPAPTTSGSGINGRPPLKPEIQPNGRSWYPSAAWLALLLAFVLPIRAEILISDSFNYADGSLATSGGTAWRTLTGTTGQIRANAGALRAAEGEFEIVETPLPGGPRDQGTLYAGFTVTVSALPSGTGSDFAAFSAANGPRTLGRVFVTTEGAAPGSFRIGVANALQFQTATVPMDLVLNTPYRVVVRHQLPFHVSTLWVNPASEETGGVDPTESTFPGSIAAYAFRQRLIGGNGMGTVTVDDLVVATTFGEAKSPPLPPKSTLDPQLIGRWEADYVTDVKAEGNYAYALSRDGFSVIDIRDPASPQTVGRLAGEFGGSVALAGSLAYAGYRQGLGVIDISTPTNPRLIGSLATSGPAVVVVAGSVVYLADWIGGFRVVDVSNSAQPKQIARLTTPKPAEGLAVSGQYAYLSVGESGLWVIDIGNPAQPRRVGQISVSQPSSLNFFLDVAVSGRFVFAAEFGNALFGGGMNVVDVSDPTRPVRVATVPFDNLDSLAVADGLAYLAGPGEPGDLAVFDVTNPAAPKRVGTGPAPAGGNPSLVISGGRLFHCNWQGFRILTLPKLPPALAFAVPSRLEEGGLRLTLRGSAGQAFEIQRSTDLVKWETWITGTLQDSDTAGKELFDESASQTTQRFYRARQP